MTYSQVHAAPDCYKQHHIHCRGSAAWHISQRKARFFLQGINDSCTLKEEEKDVVLYWWCPHIWSLIVGTFDCVLFCAGLLHAISVIIWSRNKSVSISSETNNNLQLYLWGFHADLAPDNYKLSSILCAQRSCPCCFKWPCFTLSSSLSSLLL